MKLMMELFGDFASSTLVVVQFALGAVFVAMAISVPFLTFAALLKYLFS